MIFIKPILLSSFVLFNLFTLGQDTASYITWSNKKLTWNDFKKTPDSADLSSNKRAVSYLSLTQKYNVSNNEIIFTIKALFDCNKSWVKKDVQNNPNKIVSDLVLEHEQHHFDIAELYARQIREAISKIVFSRSTYEKDIKLLFKKYYDQYKEEQKKYDNEAGHSNFNRQYDWVKAIDKQMDNYKKFSDTIVITHLQ